MLTTAADAVLDGYAEVDAIFASGLPDDVYQTFAPTPSGHGHRHDFATFGRSSTHANDSATGEDEPLVLKELGSEQREKAREKRDKLMLNGLSCSLP